ncbi:MAG: hypothetical protein D6690_01410 [Nitrospirae bacterium]|nr:MAG: hypothetical protein D6690_01410 [Nitrospirota bacterium]
MHELQCRDRGHRLTLKKDHLFQRWCEMTVWQTLIATALVTAGFVIAEGKQATAQRTEILGMQVAQKAVPEAIKGFDEEKVKNDPVCDSNHRPEITAVEPDEVQPGDTVTVKGQYFGRKKECLYQIIIGSVKGENLTYIDDHQLQVTIPKSAAPGLRFLNIQTGGGSARAAILIRSEQ